MRGLRDSRDRVKYLNFLKKNQTITIGYYKTVISNDATEKECGFPEFSILNEINETVCFLGQYQRFWEKRRDFLINR